MRTPRKQSYVIHPGEGPKVEREVAGNVGGNNVFSVGKGLTDYMKISIHS